MCQSLLLIKENVDVLNELFLCTDALLGLQGFDFFHGLKVLEVFIDEEKATKDVVLVELFAQGMKQVGILDNTSIKAQCKGATTGKYPRDHVPESM